MLRPGRGALALCVAVALTATALPASAEYVIRTRSPSKRDFSAAVKASRAVNREVPMKLPAATAEPQVKTVVRDGVIHERATVIANVDYDTFLKRFDPTRWSLNLPQRWGGQVVKVSDRRQDGRGAVLQQERMVLGIPALDMTKNSVVSIGKNRSRVEWQVTHSDRSLPALGVKTVHMDNGWLEFARTQDGRVQITSRSAHRVSTLPSLPIEKLAPGLAAKLTALSLASYFEKTVASYQAIGEGRRQAR